MPDGESTPSLQTASANWRLMIVTIPVALICATLAGISTQAWVEWFHHPSRPAEMDSIARSGAILWRIMLGLCTIALFAAPVVLDRFATGGIEAITPVKSVSKSWLWLTGMIVLALALRATRINESLWYDEIASWMTYCYGVKTVGAVMGNFLDPFNQVAHSVLNYFSVEWLSSQVGYELAFRLPALLFSLLSVVTVFGLARATLGERAAVIAAGLTAVLPVSVLEGVEARGYSMMVCFAAAMLWTLIEACRRRKPWLWCLYALLCALGIWAHFVTAFVPIGHAFWLAWKSVSERDTKLAVSGFAALALGAIFSITLYAPMIPQLLEGRGAFSAQSLNQPRIWGTEGLHALIQLGGSWYWWAAMPGLLLAIGGAAILFRRASSESANSGSVGGVDVIAISMAGLPLMTIVVLFAGSWMYARFTFFALPGAILLMAVGIEAVLKWGRNAGAVVIGVVCLMSLSDLYVRPAKQPLRDAAEFVRMNRVADDQMLAVGLAHPVLVIYAGDMKPGYSFRFGVDLEKRLRDMEVPPRWIIIEYPGHVSRQTWQILKDRNYSEAARFPGWVDWTHGDVLVYERKI